MVDSNSIPASHEATGRPRFLGGSWVKTGILLRGIAPLTFLMATTAGLAAPVVIDTTDANNGISDLFSATFDGSLSPCTPSDPSWCSFFGGKPGPTRAIIVTPTPTTVTNAVPLGITPVPASGSYLDLALNGDNTQLTIAGGTIAFPSITLTISGTTVVNANGAGIVFNSTPRMVAVNSDGQAEFLVNITPRLQLWISVTSRP